MSWVAVGVAGVNLISGFSAKKKAEKQAASDRVEAQRLQDEQLSLAKKQDARADTLFNQYQSVYAPRERQFVQEAFTPITADEEEAKAVADVRGSLANSRRASEQRLRSVGVNPASGAAAGFDTARSLEEARIEGAARTRARGSVRDLNFERQRTALALGNPGAATPYASMAQTGVGNVASLANRRAEGSESLAYQGGVAAGSATGEFIDAAVPAFQGLAARRTKSSAVGVDVPGRTRLLDDPNRSMVA